MTITNLVNIFTSWLLTLQDLWNTMTTPISYFLEPLIISNPIFSFVGAFLKVTGFYNLTLVEFMLGAGLALYIGYQLLIWVLNLVT